MNYTTVSLIIEELTKKRSSTLGADVRTLMSHYTQMLRRHIVSESEIADLCRRIYKKHKLALDIIFEHRPDERAEMMELIKNLIEANADLRIDTVSRSVIRFAPKEWFVPRLMKGQGWTPSGQMLLFECQSGAEFLKIVLYIGPGPDNIRKELFSLAKQNTPIFRTQSKSLNRKWNSILSKKLLQSKDFEDGRIDNLDSRIEKGWNDFIQNHLPKIMNVVQTFLDRKLIIGDNSKVIAD